MNPYGDTQQIQMGRSQKKTTRGITRRLHWELSLAVYIVYIPKRVADKVHICLSTKRLWKKVANSVNYKLDL